MANVGNSSGSTRYEELCREMTQLNDELKKLDVSDCVAIEEAIKKLTDMNTKLKELCEKMKETVKETKETPQ
ncbi:unnamed protein product [Arabidopsis lyrata]|uniref:Uncharacterized protein n=1 Tax=Arabidopsis lyrata subsp. lyrata TaxID=81972 RepID=D7KGV7_ARALL|nr:uncharacterized protein LOC9327671 [Arabidopsis lyrata subsp. lyrata]EFH67868.1 hypothetical protein ARALYDRAFT_892056 [Arabidopsis lyrata subsp. lyrata]CAH8255237.1 unnamed protein product [Arabidopsis lyrata]|eukprot:XP_002891609.1 uncharacterized protein LOC9327671 [Arabidopsis lyrata subsp. lyrata]